MSTIIVSGSDIIRSLLNAIRDHAVALDETMAAPNSFARGKKIARLLRELEAIAEKAEANLIAEGHDD